MKSDVYMLHVHVYMCMPSSLKSESVFGGDDLGALRSHRTPLDLRVTVRRVLCDPTPEAHAGHQSPRGERMRCSLRSAELRSRRGA